MTWLLVGLAVVVGVAATLATLGVIWLSGDDDLRRWLKTDDEDDQP
jgi:hypothetical protein